MQPATHSRHHRRMLRARRVMAAKAALEEALQRSENAAGCRAALEGLGHEERELHERCVKLIDGGEPERAVKLLGLLATERSRGGKRGVAVFVALGVAGLVGFPLYMNLFAGGGGAMITSRNEACASELVAGLETLREQSGMPYEVGPEDAATFFDEGVITKDYARDGARYSIEIGVYGEEGGCRLEAFRRTVREPGSRSILRGSFGVTSLSHCACE